VERQRLLWNHRHFFLRAVGVGFLVSTLIAFLIPKTYVSTPQLMPPNRQFTLALAPAVDTHQ
jgi:uncharacterized protein involved in exopolysaccharide biosynthesis